ncbi:MAG: hypothetical protein ISN26_05735 [Betaproteobacteria bacterium AqS2]|uniref:Uncharacterized protein n=1 Tax=Candidatus Amphirhobacter heronislandensis TaxID=1732024 RepID=A0A930UCU3_9GAMM|nr:hypothetical protein [Betaproteobacteria bacterium AqS2]
MTERLSFEDCGGGSGGSIGARWRNHVFMKWHKIAYKYEHRVELKNGYTLDQFKIDMDNVLTSPELINCQSYNKTTVAHISASFASIETAKWAVSKDIDLTITDNHGRTAYDVVLLLIKQFTENKNGVYPPTPENLARLERWNRLTTILSPTPRPLHRRREYARELRKSSDQSDI